MSNLRGPLVRATLRVINFWLTVFSWLTDEMTREDALQMLRDLEPTKSERIAKLEETGFPG